MKREDCLRRSRGWRRWLLAVALALGHLFVGAGVLAEEPSAEPSAPAPVGLFDDSPSAEAPAAEAPSAEVPAAEAPSAESPAPGEVEAAAPTAEAAAPVPPAAPAAAAMEVAVEEGRITLHAKNENLVKLLETISRLNEVNIIASKSIKGTVSADL